ncbi:MAG: Asp/Glu racemase [Deltaproteobacteria bacterium]
MYGWRGRLGILVPSGNVVIEPEFRFMTPEGVACHYHRFTFVGGKSNEEVVKNLRKAEEQIADASEVISHIDPAVVVMAGTGVSFIDGYGYDQMLIKKMKERNGNLPTTTTSTSVIAAFKKLGITKVSMGMAYVEQVSRTAMKFVEDNGVKVIKAKWLNKGGMDIAEVSKETIYHLAKEVDDPESEAVFISCVNLHTIEIIEKLENDLKKPVITSNQATMWNILRLANIKDRIEGFGQLLHD